jgi:hypothetical protein
VIGADRKLLHGGNDLPYLAGQTQGLALKASPFEWATRMQEAMV